MNSLFHPVIIIPKDAPVLDLSAYLPGCDESGRVYGIGKYAEKRPNIYLTPLFGGTRNVHMGVDLFAPVGAPVHAFDDGEVHCFAYNEADGDYGATLVTRHLFEGRTLFALHGHLSMASLANKEPGQSIQKGEVIAWLGDFQENGGWPPHLHFQLSYVDPGKADMPGVVSEDQLEAALRIYPDPRIVLGPIY